MSNRKLRPVLLGLAIAAVGVAMSDALAWMTGRAMLQERGPRAAEGRVARG